MELPNRLYVLHQKTGYPITQKNGQRKFGPRPDWEGPAPPKGCEVFIGKLPRELFEDELVPVFSKVGVIYELRMMLNFSGSNRGYAFLNYSSVAEATAAIKLLHNYEIRPGHRIGVTRSADNCFLFIRGIPKDKSADEVLFEMTNKNIIGIVKISLPVDPLNECLNAGCVYVEFETHRAAAMARRVLVPGFVHFFGRELCVDWAELENCDKAFEQKQVKGLNNMNYQHVQFHPYKEELLQQSCIMQLYEFCSQNHWEVPQYHYNKHITAEGTELWVCGLDLGLKERMLRRIFSQPCLTVYQAQHNVAQKCLNVILQVLQKNDVQNIFNMSPNYENETSMMYTSQVYRPILSQTTQFYQNICNV